MRNTFIRHKDGSINKEQRKRETEHRLTGYNGLAGHKTIWTADRIRLAEVQRLEDLAKHGTVKVLMKDGVRLAEPEIIDPERY